MEAIRANGTGKMKSPVSITKVKVLPILN